MSGYQPEDVADPASEQAIEHEQQAVPRQLVREHSFDRGARPRRPLSSLGSQDCDLPSLKFSLLPMLTQQIQAR
jgi:hypothetical protein